MNLADFEKKRNRLSEYIENMEIDLKCRVRVESRGLYSGYEFDKDTALYKLHKEFLANEIESTQKELDTISEKIEACKILLK